MTERLPISAPVTTSPQRYAAARHGRLPAEALSPADQARLVCELVLLEGWTDVQIASHTRWTSYVVGRKRDRMGLAPNDGGIG